MGRVRKRKHSAHRAKGRVRFGGQIARDSLFHLRVNSSPKELFVKFPMVVNSPDQLKVLHGAPFPSRYEEMFETHAIGQPASIVSEVIWAICRCCMHGDDIKAYLALREKYESRLLLGDLPEVSSLLSDHQERMGVSLWLAQAWLTLSDYLQQEEKQLVHKKFDAIDQDSVAAFMVYYLLRRAESRGPKNYLKDEINEKLGSYSPIFNAYASIRVFDVHSANTKELSSLLFFEAQGSLIDHYEALIVALQDMASVESLPGKVAKSLAKPVSVLRKRVRDRRLDPIALAFGCTLESDSFDTNDQRASCFESYFQSNYRDTAIYSARYLENVDATDAAVLVLLARAIVRSGCEVPDLPSALKGLCENLVDVLNEGEDAYGKATAIFSAIDTNYSQSWALYLREVLMLSLQQENTSPAIFKMRRMAIFDPYISPLTLACTRETLLPAVRQELSQKRIYPYMLLAIDLLYFGVVPSNGSMELSERRRLSYLARHYLSIGNCEAASTLLSELLIKAHPNGRYRVLAELAMAKAKCTDTEKAVALLVDAYLDNPEVPTSLPLDLVVSGLSDVESWPNTIDVPIALELYNAFSSSNRLAQLRYAFERTQGKYGISKPSDISDKFGDDYVDRVKLYLDRVWTPEVMRQTLLYDGSQDIEEARIAVCRQLASIDPNNSGRYLDEIRNRVKQLEIAKGTSLIEQSKVYVDIAAIKRGLKAKIGGQYSRYKADSRLQDDASQAIVEKIADEILDISKGENVSITKLLPRLHLLDNFATETDSQFDPIFTEVTHEFLRGDHGLNAYLSTRVRHGVLANTLRKPLADERLITTKDETGQSYRRNQYWDERLDIYGEGTRNVVAGALERFAMGFDAIVHELREEYLQIEISHGVKDVRKESKAAFVYRSSNLERRFMQRYALRSRTIDEFIDVCIDNLWEKTDENLLAVRQFLDENIKLRFMTLFDQLLNDIHGIDYCTPIGDLRNGIGRAKTQLRLRLDEISTWFKRSQVYDRQNYYARLPVDIALNMITKTASDNSSVPNVVFEEYDTSHRMPGRTLDGMVDAFYIIISNALEHSGLNGSDLAISVKFDLSAEKYYVRVESNLGPDVPTKDQKKRVIAIRDGLNKNGSHHLAQIEGGSGLHKLWQSINSPFYNEPHLDFGFIENKKFFVEISYKAEASNENSNS